MMGHKVMSSSVTRCIKSQRAQMCFNMRFKRINRKYGNQGKKYIWSFLFILRSSKHSNSWVLKKTIFGGENKNKIIYVSVENP